MKIGDPVKEIPRNGAGQPAKYRAIYSAIDALENGDFLPVEFDSKDEAITAFTSFSRKYKAIRRENIIYCRKREKRHEPAR